MNEYETGPATVRLGDITLDTRLQVRSKGIHLPTLRAYTTAVRQDQELPPITLARVDGVLYVADGWHRLEAHRNAGRDTISASIVEAATIGEAHWLAAEGNLRHGRPLKAAEVREAFRRYVKARRHRHANGGYKSYREIAADLGGHRGHTTIRNWMRSDFPAVYARMSGDDRGGMGDFEVDPEEHERGLVAKVLQGFKDALNILPGIKSPARRARLLEAANNAVMEMHRGPPRRPKRGAKEADAQDGCSI